MADIEASIQRYLTELETADRQQPDIAQAKAGQLNDKIAALKAQMQQLQAIETQLAQSPDGQLSLTDPDARSMKTRGIGIVGYNVQTAVDAKHHLIVAHEVTNVGIDRDLLAGMATQAREAIGGTFPLLQRDTPHPLPHRLSRQFLVGQRSPTRHCRERISNGASTRVGRLARTDMSTSISMLPLGCTLKSATKTASA